MKKFLFALLLIAVVPVITFGQEKKLFRDARIITELEREDGSEICVFYMPDMNQYYYEVGSLGIGVDVLQVEFDPVYSLFIPLGETLEEAQAKLEEFNAHAKTARGSKMVVAGVLAFGYPNDEDLEPVTITARRILITRKLEFSVTRGDWIRATFVPRSEVVSMINGVKIYRKLHPKEK